MKRLERLVKIALVLATRRRLRAADLAEKFSISERTVYRDSVSGRKPAGPLGKVLAAVDAWSVLRIRYEPVVPGSQSERDVEPLGLVRVENAWLLVAYCRLRSDVRVFRIDRIRDAQATGERFAPRPDVSFSEVIDRERKKFSGS